MPAAGGAAGDDERFDQSGVLDGGIGVGGHFHHPGGLRPFQEPGVEFLQDTGQQPAAEPPVAVQAHHLVEPAVQVHHVDAAGVLVEPVHVLGDESGEQSPLLQPGYRGMAVVGIRPAQVRPADVVAGPVALPVSGFADEFLVGHGGPRRGAGPAVVRDARIRAQAGAGQHGELSSGQEAVDVLQDLEFAALELH